MIFFLCEDIWSMGENKGVSSLHRLIELVKQDEEILVLTPRCKVSRFRNRWASYIYHFFIYLFVNIQYIFTAFRIHVHPKSIYVSSSLPSIAGKILSVYYRCPYMQRLYGTFLYPKLGKRLSLLKSYEEVLAFNLNADRYVITDDGTFGDKVAKYFNISDEKVLFLMNGVDKKNPSLKEKKRIEICEKYGIPTNGFLVISVSRLASWKRVDRIIFAMNNLAGNNDVYYLIIGDGEQKGYYESIRKNKNIFFVGAKTYLEVKEYYLSADLFVSMYDFTNLGNPLLEAMSAGLPIITIDNGETKKIYDGNNMVLLEEKKDTELIDDLTEMIIRLKANPKWRKQLGDSAKKFADSNLLSWEERIRVECEELFRLSKGYYEK